MNRFHCRRWTRTGIGALALCIVGGCGGLISNGSAPPVLYVLNGLPNPLPNAASIAAPRGAAVLVVNPTTAAPGYEDQQIVYVRVALQLESYAHSEWVDSPAHMLSPLIETAIGTVGAFNAVMPASNGMAGNLRLDTEVLRFQQEFGNGPSRARVALRATITDSVTGKVVSTQEFEENVVCASEDAYGGVVAANRAVQVVLERLAHYCAQSAALWQSQNAASKQLTSALD